MDFLSIKKQKGSSLLMVLGLLTILSLLFIVLFNSNYSYIQINKKHLMIQNINSFQNVTFHLFENNSINTGTYKNNWICNHIGCIKNTDNQIVIETPHNCQSHLCYNMIISTTYNKVIYSQNKIIITSKKYNQNNINPN